MTEASGIPVLSVRGLSRQFPGAPAPALAGVDLDIAAGAALGLVGESGSGKTTLARCVLRLTEPDAGTVHLDGSPVTGLAARALRRRRRDMQIVFQDPDRALSPRLTVGQSVIEPLVAAGMARGARAADEAARLLERVDLDPALGASFPHELSGGQRQRAAIARALATRPRLLVADEPVSALDVSVQAHIIELLNALRRESGLTLLFISHDLAVVRQVADRVAVMHAGRIVEEGDVESVLQAPRHPYTRSLLESVPNPFEMEKG